MKIFSARFWLPICVGLIIAFVIFWPTFAKGKLPVPGDLLVSFYYPWYNGGFDGYDSWTTNKEFIAFDAIRQIIPWKRVVVDQYAVGQWPLWNPYNFSGTPLLANLQSAAFYPANILFFVFSFQNAWVLYVLLQPLLVASFTYILARHWNFSKAAAIFSASSYATSVYLLIWYQLGVIGHTVAWLPLILLATDKLLTTAKLRWWWLLVVGSVSLISAGHLQTGMHVFLVTGVFMLFRHWDLYRFKKLNLLGLIVITWILAVGALSSIQLIPALELQALSPLKPELTRELFANIRPPLKNFVTLIAPDYFGHPANRNFRSQIYGDGTPYFGITSLLLAIVAMIKAKKQIVLFLGFILAVYLTFGFPGPLYHLVRLLQIDVLTSTLSSRSLFVVTFAGSLLSGIGLDYLQKSLKSDRRSGYFITGSGLLAIFVLAIIASLSLIYSGTKEAHYQAITSLKSLFLPTSVLLAFCLGYFVLEKFKRKHLFYFLVLTPPLMFTFYQTNKTMPFSDSKFFFPNHPIIDQMKNNADLMRVSGVYTSKFDNNFASYYRLYSSEGYDSLRIDRYARLFAAMDSGKLVEQYSKSDAEYDSNFTDNQVKLMNLTSVGYLFDKTDGQTSGFHPEPSKYQPDKINLIHQENIFKIYQRTQALPRAYLVSSYEVITDEARMIQRLFDSSFQATASAILEIDPKIEFNASADNHAQITDYTPNRVLIETNNDQPALLVLTDSYYPGWTASVNQIPQEILRVNHSFRGVIVPAGINQVEFTYLPKSFKTGLALSISGLGLISLMSFYLTKSKRLTW